MRMKKFFPHIDDMPGLTPIFGLIQNNLTLPQLSTLSFCLQAEHSIENLFNLGIILGTFKDKYEH